MGLEIYKLNPAGFLTAPGSMASNFKNNRVRLDLLTDIDMVSMVEKDIIRGICHVIHRYAKTNNKYMKYYDKNKESSYLKYRDANNLCGWAKAQKLPVNDFRWVEHISELNEDFIKSYNYESDEGYFLEVDVHILKISIIFTMVYPFYLKE